MIIHNIGYHHDHDSDFIIERPDGSGDNLMLLLRTGCIFTINGEDITVPENTFFIYKKGSPQYYRCLPKSTFSNDWVHFDFEDNEEREFLALGLEYEKAITMDNLLFLSFCMKMAVYEEYSENINRKKSVYYYMFLIFNKVSEQLAPKEKFKSDKHYEMLSTIRNKIYAEPWVNRSIDYASHEVRMSRANFQLLYKKYFGVTFVQDLINSRIEHAKMLLLNTDLSAKEIATQCGYRSYAHFARQLKKYTNMTPLELRSNAKS